MTVLACLIQAGLFGAAHSKEISTSGQALLFSKNPSGQAMLFSNDAYKSLEALPEPIPSLNDISPAAGPTMAPDNPASLSSEDPVDLLADRVEYDENAGIVSAIGNVELVQSGRILRAKKVSYNLNKDKVNAEGDVVLNEATGDTYFADKVELKDKMKDGFVRGLSGVLADGSRFSAEEAEKIADLKIIMREASYTACEECKEDPSRPPDWQLRAEKVTHHKDEQRVSYENAWFEVAGRPILYTPYFSHPDGSVERKSGFLTPTAGFDSDLGAFYQQEYYWSIAPNRDATVGAVVMTEEAPLLTGEYRQRFEKAELELDGAITYSSRTDRVAGQDVKLDEEERAHLFGKAIWDINDKWRAGSELALVSDEQYLRQYNISNKDVLQNSIYAERFSGRDYATGRFIRFKDIRTSNRAADQPSVLPQIHTSFLGDPNALLGGRWSVGLSALGLHREGNDQDMVRGSLELGWERRLVSDIGLVSKIDLSSRGDLYRTHDRDISDDAIGRSTNASAIRGFSSATLETGYPIAKNLDSAQWVIEPLASITAGTNLNDNNDIPNEDSQDVFLDATNIFNTNRFPGYDRIEDEVHSTYGVRTGIYADNGYQGEVFFGQSYRFDRDDNPFPRGSGLSEQESDFVGSVAARAGSNFQINYGMQLKNDSLASQRHEIDAKAKVSRISLNTRYFYANALQGTDLDTSREQIRVGAKYNFTDQWGIFGSSQYDLARETEGLRKLSYGLDYQGQCVNFLISGQRTLTRDSSGDSGTEIMMRLGLKNLGEFETTAFTLGSE